MTGAGPAESFGVGEKEWEKFLRERGLDPLRLTPESARDLRLCAGCCAGDGEAWAAFHREFGPFLRACACKLTRDFDAAEEMAAGLAADLMAGDRLKSYSGSGSFRGWLRAVISHRFLDGKRRETRFRTESMDEVERLAAPPSGDDDDCRRHFQPALLEEAAGHLGAALGRLSEREAGFLNLYYFQEKTLAEAAELLGVHESTACRWNVKILKVLQKDLYSFFKRQKRWSASDIAGFMETCMGYLAGRLESFRSSALSKLFPQDGGGGTSNR